ncbi:MAG: ABC transporter permease [Ruminococcus sp.]|nr:ABC transporter permease [Ruminococcus sp.]
MLKNHNTTVIQNMAKRSFRTNRRRNISILLAVLFSTFLTFCIFTGGATFFEMQQTQGIRLHGAEYDAYLYGLTREQQELCRENPDILRSGIEAVAGYVVETEQNDTPDAGLLWTDETCWEEMRKPGRTWMEGHYPQKADEVLVKRESLKSCGLEGLKTGDTFTMTYGTALGEFTGEFRISGMWDGYGAKDVVFVSKAFYEQSGHELSSVASGRYMIDFKPKLMTRAKQEAFIESLHLEKQQNLFFNMEYENAVQVLAGAAGLAGIACLCACLLIYNIMYLSVSGNIRYYGLLQTVGMTGKQIRRLVGRQLSILAAAGAAGGLAIGAGVSFWLIPSVVKSMGVYLGKQESVRVAFHPWIVLLSVLLAALTVFAAGQKPARAAAAISPVEALGYRPCQAGKRSRRTGRGGVLWRLAKEQLTKDKKKAGIVILSLSAGLSLFLCLVTLLESEAARTIVSNYMDMDMVLENKTLKKENREDRRQVMDGEFLDELRGIEGLEEIYEVRCREILVPWEPDFSDMWMEEFYDMWMVQSSYEDEGRKNYKDHPEEYSSFIVGINETEFSCLNSTLEEPADEQAFLEGQTCILYRNGLAFTDGELRGRSVTCADFEDPGHRRTFQVGGLTDVNDYTGESPGCAPTLIVSDGALREFSEEAFVYKVSLRYSREYDRETEGELRELVENSGCAKNISCESKLEEMETVKKAQGNMMEVGLGMVLILALIGILNYVNTLVGNIRSREMEISVMESIGMSRRQVRRMLVMEGLLFAGGSLCVTWTAGLAATYMLYQSMNYRKVPFAVPAAPMAAASVLVLAVCAAVPLMAYRSMEKKGTVVERLRGAE